MKHAFLSLFWLQLLAIPCSAWAQDETTVPFYLHNKYPEIVGNENPRATTNLGMPLTAALGPTSQHVSWGLGMSAGAGYNFNRNHALVGEFMWNWLYPTNSTLRPIQIALNTNKVNGHGNLFAFTGGYKFECAAKPLEPTSLLAADGITAPLP